MARATWNGVVIAESDAYEVVEGNVYFPPGAVRREHLRPSETHTVCGWKGTASYYTVVVDGQDVLAVYMVMKEAVERARRGEGPTLIEAKTYRIVPHSSDDDDRLYRTREEVEPFRTLQDPINRIKTYILEHSLASQEQLDEIERGVRAEINDATEWAEQQPDPIAEEGALYVFAPASE